MTTLSNSEETRVHIKKFLDEVGYELNKLLSDQHIKYYIHEDFQEIFFKYRDELKKSIYGRIDLAKKYLDDSDIKLDGKLFQVGWTGKELEFKLSLWEKVKDGVGKGWKWLQSKLDIINIFLGSLSSAGIPGIEAIKEIKESYEAARNE